MFGTIQQPCVLRGFQAHLSDDWGVEEANSNAMDCEENKQLSLESSKYQNVPSELYKGRLSYFGHIMTADNSLEKIIMQRKTEGKQGRGRPRARWWDNILARVGRPPIETIRTTTGRSAWRQRVNMVTISCFEIGT